MNAITASACDMVLTGCPLSILKYKEKGYEAHFINFENNILNNYKLLDLSKLKPTEGFSVNCIRQSFLFHFMGVFMVIGPKWLYLKFVSNEKDQLKIA